MRAAILSIGDELTTGQRLDTNSQWLSQQLADLGVHVVMHITVADALDENMLAFRQAVERADFVIATGGLGPTADDLTRDVLAGLVGAELVLDDESLEHIRGLFARRSRPMPERNVVQAMFPRGSQIIPNPEGTAPGILLPVPRADGKVSYVIALPGVPAEMRSMWEQSIVALLVRLGAGQQVTRHRRIKCFGVGESELEKMLPDLIRRGRTPLVGITVHEATITLRITATAATEADCIAQMKPTIETIRECLGTLIFGEEDDELEHAALRLVGNRRQTLSTIEWGLEGLIGHWLAAADHGTGVVRASQIVSSPSAAQSLFEPKPATSSESADPACIAEQLAMRCQAQGDLAADYLLAVVLQPVSDSDVDASRRLGFAIAGPGGVETATAPFAGHSAILQPLAAKRALNFLRLHLLGSSSP